MPKHVTPEEIQQDEVLNRLRDLLQKSEVTKENTCEILQKVGPLGSLLALLNRPEDQAEKLGARLLKVLTSVEEALAQSNREALQVRQLLNRVEQNLRERDAKEQEQARLLKGYAALLERAVRTDGQTSALLAEIRVLLDLFRVAA